MGSRTKICRALRITDRKFGYKNGISVEKTYPIFPIKRPRRLFQTWPDGPGVYSKSAFNRVPALICEVFFLPAILSSCFIITQPPRTNKVGPDGTIFPFIVSDKLSLGLPLVTHHSIQHSYYCMLQPRCVKKERKQYMPNIEAR